MGIVTLHTDQCCLAITCWVSTATTGAGLKTTWKCACLAIKGNPLSRWPTLSNLGSSSFVRSLMTLKWLVKHGLVSSSLLWREYLTQVIHHNGEEVESFSLKKGRNRMCLSRLGKYTLEPRSCHRFDGPSPIVYDTANPRPINLHAVAHQAVVTMSTNRAYLDSNLKEEKISVHVHSSRGKGLSSVWN